MHGVAFEVEGDRMKPGDLVEVATPLVAGTGIIINLSEMRSVAYGWGGFEVLFNNGETLWVLEHQLKVIE